MAARITGVQTVALPELRPAAWDTVPDWALPAVRTPRAQDWPENRTRLGVELTTEDGAGRFAPVGAAVAQLIIEQLGPGLVGRDALSWRWLDGLELAGRHQRGSHARMALSAVELALWDLRSRVLQRPITELLGGARREYVPVYATALGLDIDHPLAGDLAQWIANEGFWAQKWRLPGCARGEPAQVDIARLARLREAVREQTRLCLDIGGGWDRSYARQLLPALAEHQVAWVEEPGPVPSNWFATAGIAVAGGEHEVDPETQHRTLLSGDVQVWQPEPSWHGGLVPSLRSTEVATAEGLLTCPHGSSLPVASLLAGLHTAEQIPAIEYHLTLEPLRQAGTYTPLTPESGWLPVRTDPGLATSPPGESPQTRQGA